MLPSEGEQARLGGATAAGVQVVGRSDLGGAGLNGAVAVVGTIAIVGAGITPAAGIHTHFYTPYPCASVSVKIVDLSSPGSPRVVSAIPLPAGVAAIDVAALHVRSPSFTGDLAAIALAQCDATGSVIDRGVTYYDVSIPASPRFLGRYLADADSVHPASVPPCGPPPGGSARRCASSQHSVSLAQRADGRVISVSTEPGASASNFPSGDVRIVDVTDPRAPIQIGAYPGRGRPIFSRNGCRPFSAAHDAEISPDGMRVLVAYFDGGVYDIDISTPAAPAELARFGYPDDRMVEGNAAYVTGAVVNGRRLAFVSEEDWIGSKTSLRVESPASVAGTRFGCEAMFTLFDRDRTAQLHRQPGNEVRGDVAYVGRGCPANPGKGGHAGTVAEDPYLSDPRGKIALVDRTRQPTQPGVTSGAACSAVESMQRARAAGAIGVVIAQTIANAPVAFSPDGDSRGADIPVMQIDKPDADALRAVLCPSIDSAGRCESGERVPAAMTTAPGEWGGLRVIDRDAPQEISPLAGFGTPRSQRFQPTDLGVYSVHHAVVRGEVAYVAWNSDGLRLLDLSGEPREAAYFIPQDSPDPTGALPSKAYVVGVAVTDAGDVVVIDINSGLYVLAPIRLPKPR